MRVDLPVPQDQEIAQIFERLKTHLSVLNKENLRHEVITGTTHGTADTSRKFKHGIKDLNPEEAIPMPLEGRIYIPRHGISSTQIDVRSAATSEEFRLLIVY